MKTNEMTILALIGIAACSFFFGLGQHESGAAPIANCVQSCCEPLYCWWNGTDVLTAQVSGRTPPFKAGDNTTQAITAVWLGASTPGGCGLGPAGNYDQYNWQTYGPICANNAQGQTPTPQSATPSGAAVLVPPPPGGRVRNNCV
jgi:hypothetical protein